MPSAFFPAGDGQHSPAVALRYPGSHVSPDERYSERVVQNILWNSYRVTSIGVFLPALTSCAITLFSLESPLRGRRTSPDVYDKSSTSGRASPSRSWPLSWHNTGVSSLTIQGRKFGTFQSTALGVCLFKRWSEGNFIKFPRASRGKRVKRHRAQG